jgi:hypothetical protein
VDHLSLTQVQGKQAAVGEQPRVQGKYSISARIGVTARWIKFEAFTLDPIGKSCAFLREGSGDSVAFFADYVLEQLKNYPQEHGGQSMGSRSSGLSHSLATNRPMSNGRTSK